MRIFCAIRHSNNPRHFSGGLWSSNFYPALRSLGHEVVESQTDLLPTSLFMDVASDFTCQELATRADTTQKIIDEVIEAKRTGPVDLFFSYFYNAHFDPTAFDELRKLGIPSINFYCNSIYQFDLVSKIAACADFSWHPERAASPLYKSVGGNPVWVTFGADPDLYRPIDGSMRAPKACFVGQRYADRASLLTKLFSAGVPVDIYGGGWEEKVDQADLPYKDSTYLGRVQRRSGTFGSYVNIARNTFTKHGLKNGFSRLSKRAIEAANNRRNSVKLRPSVKGIARDMVHVLNAYEVALNFSNVWADGEPGSRLTPHIRLRDFEAPMSGACYLTGATEEIGEFYEIGVEIDTYQDTEELIDKARFYLHNPHAAAHLRMRGFLRARAEHTWTRRFEELFRKMGYSIS